MGTRSTVKFFDGETQLLAIYQQYDGMISGVGHSLANWLKDKKVINGFGGKEQTKANGYANGMGCLAAQYVADKKTEIGGFYITSPDDEELYNYEVRFIDGKFNIIVDKFNGTPEKLLVYKEEDEE